MSTFALPDGESAECARCKRIQNKADFAFPYECFSCVEDVYAEMHAEYDEETAYADDHAWKWED